MHLHIFVKILLEQNIKQRIKGIKDEKDNKKFNSNNDK
jgi:hypothetical protein